MTRLCPACGERLHKRADHCFRCGASTAALPVDNAYEPLGGDPVITIGGAGKGRRGWLVAGVLVVALGGGALLAGHATDGATSAATTTSTVARTTTTIAPTATTRPSRSTTSRATTTTLAITITGGAVLPEPTGQSLYTVNASGDVYRIDLDTGLITHSYVDRSFQSPKVVTLDDGALVFDESSAGGTGFDDQTVMYHVGVDGSVETITIALPTSARLGAPGVGVWLYGPPERGGQKMTLVASNGDVLQTLTLPPGVYGTTADGDGLVFPSGSGAYRANENGLQRIAAGELIALSDRYAVATECDETYQCSVIRTDRKSGHADNIGPRPEELTYVYQLGALSPDGNVIAVIVYRGFNSPPTQGFYDLRTNTVNPIPDTVLSSPGPQAWTASGWSAIADNDSNVVFVRGNELQAVDLPSRSNPMALTIGPTPAGAATPAP